MIDTEALKSLRERVLAASGPDRDIEKAILHAMGFSWRGMDYWHADNKTIFKGSPFFTSSIDAALALVERCLPGALYELKHGFFYDATVWLAGRDYDDFDVPFARVQSSMPLAILAALLSALISQQEQGAK